MRSFLLVLLGICVGAAVVWFILAQRAPDSGPGGQPPAPSREFVYIPSELKPLDPERITVDERLQTEVVEDQLLVALPDDVDEATFVATIRQRGLPVRVVGRLPSVGSLQVEVPANRRAEIQRTLEADPRLVASVGANRVWYATRTFDDPFLQVADEDDWGLRKIGAFEAWDVTTGGALVAVVDSGSKLDHEELVGKSVSPYSYATRSSAMQRQTYTNENGQRDYVTAHGTHVAVTIAGHAGNGRGTAGVAPDSPYVPIQVLYLPSGGNKVVGSTPDIIDGMLRAIAAGAQVINMSLGSSPTEAAQLAFQTGSEADRRQVDQALSAAAREELKLYARVLDLAQRERVIVVKAAGNEAVPARWDGLCASGRVIGVAATDPKDERAHFGVERGLTFGSNYGLGTTVSAPGLGIWSGHPDPSGYASFNGTSMAAPHVAGLVALLKTKKPDLTFEEVRDILIASGTALTLDPPIGPRINAPAALAELDRRIREGVPPPPAMPPVERPPSPPFDPVAPGPPGMPPTPTPSPPPGYTPTPAPPPFDDDDTPPPDHVRPPPPTDVPPPDHVRLPPPTELPPPEHVRPPPPRDVAPPVRTPVPPPPLDDDDAPPPDDGVPPQPPTYEEILKGPRPWENVQVQVRIDMWLGSATPPAALTNPDAGPWRFDQYGRALGARMVRNVDSPPDYAGYRYRYLWEQARAYSSTNLGTLYEYLHKLSYTAPPRPDTPTPPRPVTPTPPRADPPERPTPATVTVPDTRGRTRADAERRLRSAGFQVQVDQGRAASSANLVGRVQETIPAAGTGARKGSRVTLRLYGAVATTQPVETAAYCLVCKLHIPENAYDGVTMDNVEEFLRTLDVSRLTFGPAPGAHVFRVSRKATRTYVRSMYKAGTRFSIPGVVTYALPGRTRRTIPVSYLIEVVKVTESYNAAVAFARTLADDNWKPAKNTQDITRADGTFVEALDGEGWSVHALSPVPGWPLEHKRRLVEGTLRMFE